MATRSGSPSPLTSIRSVLVCEREMVEPTDGMVLRTAAGLPLPFFLVKLIPRLIEVADVAVLAPTDGGVEAGECLQRTEPVASVREADAARRHLIGIAVAVHVEKIELGLALAQTQREPDAGAGRDTRGSAGCLAQHGEPTAGRGARSLVQNSGGIGAFAGGLYAFGRHVEVESTSRPGRCGEALGSVPSRRAGHEVRLVVLALRLHQCLRVEGDIAVPFAP